MIFTGRMEEDDIRKEFEKLGKKFDIPSFEELDSEFEISLIEHKQFMLREIRKKICERLESVIKVLDEILQPDTNINNLYECKEFNDEEKGDIFKLYKRLMVLNRWSAKVNITHIDEEEAEFINESYKELKELKSQLVNIMEKLKESWKKDTDIQEDLGYMG